MKHTYSSTAQPSCVFTMNKIECKIFCWSSHIFEDIAFYVFTVTLLFVIAATHTPKKTGGSTAQPTSMFN